MRHPCQSIATPDCDSKWISRVLILHACSVLLIQIVPRFLFRLCTFFSCRKHALLSSFSNVFILFSLSLPFPFWWCVCFRIRLEQIEKRRAEVNEEMAEIVNRFEAATESLQPTFSDTYNDSSIQNNSLLERNTTDNHMDQSEDDSYYHNNFKSSVNKRNDESSKHDDERDESSNDDTNDESCSKIQKGMLCMCVRKV